MSNAYNLAFLLPRTLTLSVAEGRHQPSLAGCVLIVNAGLVTIEGPSRERVFDQARRFFRIHAKDHAAFSVSAILTTPPRVCAGRDGWTIIVGADVAFSPTSIEPHLPRAPDLKLVSAE